MLVNLYLYTVGSYLSVINLTLSCVIFLLSHRAQTRAGREYRPFLSLNRERLGIIGTFSEMRRARSFCFKVTTNNCRLCCVVVGQGMSASFIKITDNCFVTRNTVLKIYMQKRARAYTHQHAYTYVNIVRVCA